MLAAQELCGLSVLDIFKCRLSVSPTPIPGKVYGYTGYKGMLVFQAHSIQALEAPETS